ncbi:hypothetical protein ACQEXU_09465 [Vibrio sp. TRT 21S02]|uniref:hypothetical protein n=1 Tax=unclassified Vibrio TaxID=2614977 RepID=UPI00349F7AAF
MKNLLIFVLLQLASCSILARDFVIITLNDEIKPLRTNQVKMLYRGRVTHLDGIPARLMDLPNHSENRQLFYKTLLNKSPTQMNAIWARQSFSGKALAPFEIPQENLELIVTWLKDNPNGIAYVPEEQVPEDVRVIYYLKSKG